MSEARVRQKRGQRLLKENPICIYCGAPATTTDHCPPRCFFEGRHWPETYEFPACKPCNERARLDEQALAVLIRAKATGAMNHEWEKLAQGVKNNQPAIVAEWTSLSRNEQKHALRDLFGRDSADNLRRLGWKAFNVGPLSEAMINRFMVKLSKALYFRHNNALLDGVVYVLHINALSKDITPEFMNSILAIPTSLPALQRNNTSLLDQFIYRFNHSPEHGVMYAVVQFGEQFVFQLIALSSEMARGLVTMAQANGTELPDVNRFDCFLRQQG